MFVDDGLHGASTVGVQADIQGAPLAGVFSKSASLEVSGVVHGGEGIDWGGQVLHGDAVVAVEGADDCATPRVRRLGDFLHEPPYRLPDPWGESEEVFEEVFERVSLAVDNLVERIGSHGA